MPMIYFWGYDAWSISAELVYNFKIWDPHISLSNISWSCALIMHLFYFLHFLIFWARKKKGEHLPELIWPPLIFCHKYWTWLLTKSQQFIVSFICMFRFPEKRASISLNDSWPLRNSHLWHYCLNIVRCENKNHCCLPW